LVTNEVKEQLCRCKWKKNNSWTKCRGHDEGCKSALLNQSQF